MSLTVQTIFDTVMALDNERDLISGGDEVARGLVIVSTVTKWLESEAALMPGALTTHNLLYTAANTETSSWPANLLRLDALWYVDSATNRPVWELDPIQGVGHHVPGFSWPLSELVLTGSASTITGKPKEYAASGPGGQFYWAPLPDAEYWIRGYGLWALADNYFSLATDTFPFPSSLRLPFSIACVHLFKTGLDGDLTAVEALLKTTFRRTLKGLQRFNRSEPQSRVYSEVHDA
jgi:hypothetical protein